MEIDLQIKYNKNTEAQQIYKTCQNIADGFFQNNRHLLSDRYYPGYGWIVYLPRFTFSDIDNYWDLVKKDDTTVQNQIDEFDIQLLTKKELKNFKQEMLKFMEILQQKISQVFGTLPIKKINVTIIPTKYGAQRTFAKARIEDEIMKIDPIILRQDSTFYDLTNMIVSSIVQYTLVQPWNDVEWGSKHNLVKYLMKKTALSEIDNLSKASYKVNRKDNVDWDILWKKSNSYFAELGFPVDSKISLDGNGNIYLNNNIVKGLSKTEIKIFKYFIRNKNRVISQHELGDVIWDNEVNSFSLAAVVKHMQRLREKLNVLDRNSELITTISGRGYILYD